MDKRNLGETRHFCPVTLKEKQVLWPGDQEIGARYREKIYLFSSSENKTKFMDNPDLYAPSQAPITVIINELKTLCFHFCSCLAPEGY